MKRIGTAVVVAFGIAGASSVSAAPCSGFNDVDSASAFCPSVDWLKNRGITVGCAAGLYCPGDPVIRLDMAAFMNRLGNALEPKFVHASQMNIASSVNTSSLVCATPVFDAANFPRVVSPVGAMLYLNVSGATPANFNAMLQYSTNAGITWNNWSSVQSFGGSANNVYTTLAPTANPITVNAGSQLTFAILPGNFGGTAFNAGCELTVRIDSHTGTSSPF